MASRRMIGNNLGDSEKIEALPNDTHRFAYVLLVSYADSEGRFIADPVSLNGKLYTRCGYTPTIIEQALVALHDVNLIVLYQHDRKRYGVIVDFHKYNTIRLNADGSPRDEAISRLPSPPAPDPAGDPILPNKQPRSTLPKYADRVRVRDATAESSPWQPRSTPDQPRSNPGPTPAEVEVEVEVEVEPQVEDKKVLKPSSLAATRATNHQAFVDAWNWHRGALPECQSLDTTRQRGIDRLIKEYGDGKALAMFVAATRHVAADDFWVQKGFGITNLLVAGRVLERAEKFTADQGMSAGDRKLATTAATIARAIGGLDA
jgi:hypothetical protein